MMVYSQKCGRESYNCMSVVSSNEIKWQNVQKNTTLLCFVSSRHLYLQTDLLVQGKASIITHITFFFSFQNSPHRILDDLLGCVGGMFKTVMIASSNTSFKPSCNFFFFRLLGTWLLLF